MSCPGFLNGGWGIIGAVGALLVRVDVFSVAGWLIWHREGSPACGLGESSGLVCLISTFQPWGVVSVCAISAPTRRIQSVTICNLLQQGEKNKDFA